MAHIILPQTGGGVSIYNTPADLPGASTTGTLASVISDQSIRQFDGAVWVVVADGTLVYSVDDTNSINLTNTLGAISADLRLSAAAAAATFVAVALDIQTDGLRAQLLSQNVRDLFDVLDTNSIDLGYSSLTGVFTAGLKLSATAATAGSQLVNLNIETDGLRAQIFDTAIQSTITVLDTASVDLTYTGGQISAALRLSAAAAGASTRRVTLTVEADGLLAVIPDANIWAALSVSDTNSIDSSFAGGVFSSDLRLSGNAADAGSFLVQLSIESTSSVGLRAQVANSAVRGLLSGVSPINYNSTTGAISVDDASGAQDGVVSTGTQSFAGDKTFTGATTLGGGATFTGSLVRSNNATNATFVDQPEPSTAGATAANLATATATFLGAGLLFLIEVGADHVILATCSFASAAVTILSDLSAQALLTDTGTGIYIFKGASSAVLSLKNRTGGSAVVRVRALGAAFSSSTAWA